jgi:hypothetical protein
LYTPKVSAYDPPFQSLIRPCIAKLLHKTMRITDYFYTPIRVLYTPLSFFLQIREIIQ